MEKLTAVLQQYSIYPQAIINVTDKLYKIKADGKQYALKRSSLTAQQLDEWLSVYNFAERKELHAILPVYLTANKQLYVKSGEEIYYLSPWLESGVVHFDQKFLNKFYSMLGKIHLKTKQLYKLNKQEVVKSFSSYKDNCSADEKGLLATIETIEKRHYPSPFELQVLTHYRDLSLALKQSQYLADTIISLTADTAEWSTSLVHGNLQSSHIFEQYIINWEKASHKHAFHDLSDFFMNVSPVGNRKTDSLTQSFPAYLEENPYTNLELSMLKLYLLNTSNYLSVLQIHRSNHQKSQTMVEQTIELEKSYRKIVFGLNFSKNIHVSDPINHT